LFVRGDEFGARWVANRLECAELAELAPAFDLLGHSNVVPHHGSSSEPLASKSRARSTVKTGTASLVRRPPGPWTTVSENPTPEGLRWTSICFSGPMTSQHSLTPAQE